jgi:CheY-like chemotaxis protein
MIYALIVLDDDPVILQMLDFQIKKVLRSQFIVAEFYTSPVQAIQEILDMPKNGVKPVLLITDYQMPEKNGAQVIRELKSQLPELKCVMLSGQANAIQVDDLVSEDLLSAFIMKPWTENELLGVLTSILEEKNLL